MIFVPFFLLGFHSFTLFVRVLADWSSQARASRLQLISKATQGAYLASSHILCSSLLAFLFYSASSPCFLQEIRVTAFRCMVGGIASRRTVDILSPSFVGRQCCPLRQEMSVCLAPSTSQLLIPFPPIRG